MDSGQTIKFRFVSAFFPIDFASLEKLNPKGKNPFNYLFTYPELNF